MRFSIISIVFRKELREMLRNRRSLTIMFGIPLVLYPALTILISTVGMSQQKKLHDEVAKVAVVNIDAAPHLKDLMTRKNSGVAITDSSNPKADLSAGHVDGVLIAPPDAEKDALASGSPQFITEVDRSRTSSAAADGKMNRVLDRYEQWIIEQRLAAHGQPSSLLQPLKRKVEDVATDDQRFGKMLAMALPVLLLMTGMLGALFPALNATTTERELGTLETLLVTPAGRMELLVAKGTLVLLSALLTAGLNMLSMSLVLWRVLSMESGLARLKISVGALALSYLAAVPTLITFATLVLIVGLLARNFREANSLATPVMLIPLASMMVGMMEPAMTPGLLVTPVANTTIIIREALHLAHQRRTVRAGVCLILRLRRPVAQRRRPGVHQRTTRQPRVGTGVAQGLSRKSNGKSRPRRLPAVDEVLALFAVTLLLSFYIQPSLLRFGLIPLLLISQIGLLAGPAILLAWAAAISGLRPSPGDAPRSPQPSAGCCWASDCPRGCNWRNRSNPKFSRPIARSRSSCSSSSFRRWNIIQSSFR